MSDNELDAARYRIARLEGLVDQLYREKVATMERGGKPCEHVTLRPPHLPCPHPNCCSFRGPVFSVMRQREPAGWVYGELTPAISRCEREDWERLPIDGLYPERLWGWRRVR